MSVVGSATIGLSTSYAERDSQDHAAAPPIVDAVLALIGLVLILRNAEVVLIGLRVGTFNLLPTVLLVVGIALCVHAFRSWNAARISAPAASVPPVAPKAPGASATPAAP